MKELQNIPNKTKELNVKKLMNEYKDYYKVMVNIKIRIKVKVNQRKQRQKTRRDRKQNRNHQIPSKRQHPQRNKDRKG